jgi:hypothetical protein
MPCHKCPSPTTCDESQPLQCTGTCPTGLTGLLCDQSIDCNKVDLCNGHGYKGLLSDGRSCGQCQCDNDNWVNYDQLVDQTAALSKGVSKDGECGVCRLLFQTKATTTTLCHQTQTDFQKTNEKCEQCVCLPGIVVLIVVSKLSVVM